MRRGLRISVADGQATAVLIDDVSRGCTREDFAKEAIGLTHGRMITQSLAAAGPSLPAFVEKKMGQLRGAAPGNRKAEFTSLPRPAHSRVRSLIHACARCRRPRPLTS